MSIGAAIAGFLGPGRVTLGAHVGGVVGAAGRPDAQYPMLNLKYLPLWHTGIPQHSHSDLANQEGNIEGLYDGPLASAITPL